jgi:hypothetical protein
MNGRRLSRAAAAAAATLLVAESAHAIRPTDGDGWFGNGYDPGVEVKSYPSPGGHFKVWWVEESVDAVQPGDTDGDLVPDFVELVAEHADSTWVSAIDERGFRPPLDDSVYHDTQDWGGDERYDIYLQNISDSDGYRVAEVCTAQPDWCSGYFVMENDFTGFGYPSDDFAIRILTSHELFHSLQDAYDADQDRKWTEGTAVWNTEQVFPDTDDFERFLPAFLGEPERPFDRAGGAIVDAYPYGAAIWARYLTERFGDDAVLAIWTACENLDGGDLDFLEATDVVARERGSTITDAWLEFTRWNLFTGERADETRAYRDAAAWPPVRMEEEVAAALDEPITVRIEGMSARYVPITVPEATATLRVSLVEGRTRVAAYPIDGAGTTLGEPLLLGGGDPDFVDVDPTTVGARMILVVTGVRRGALPEDTLVTFALAPEPPPMEEDDGGCAISSPGGRSGAAGAAIVTLLAAACWASRRARRSRAPSGTR